MSGVKPPYIIITACSQSHPFEERRVNVPTAEEDALKIGRSVAKWKPSSDNAIFDCKVLSRNHALLWYEEGCFYLKDTKSSNGTFVNNERLSKSAEESAPKEIFSGDILQFGVDIIENTNKVTHGCIVAMVRLFDCSGEEVCAPERNTADTNERTVAMQSFIKSNQLFQLQQYVREATHREHLLDQKLETLEAVLAATVQATEKSWQALINEDRLLSRIEMLEGQLALHSKNVVTDKVKEEMSQLLEDRNKFENLAKESLRRVQEEKFEAMQRITDVERSLMNTEEECSAHRERISELELELAKASATNKSLNEMVVELQRLNAAVTGGFLNNVEQGSGRVLENGLLTHNVQSHEEKQKVFDEALLSRKEEELFSLRNEVRELMAQNTELKEAVDILKKNRSEMIVEKGASTVSKSFDDEIPVLLLCILPLLAVFFAMYEALVRYCFVKRKTN